MEKNKEIVKTNAENGLETKDQQKQRDIFLKQLESFTKNLNAQPNPKKILKHEGYDYIPVSVIEKDLDKCFFGLVQYEIVSFQQMLNEFVVHARIKVFHPVIKQWLHYDGIGTGMMQQDKDTKIQDFLLHKKKNAGKLAVPNAYAEAIKNGAKKIGKRFGADLNRKHEDNYRGYFNEDDNKDLN